MSRRKLTQAYRVPTEPADGQTETVSDQVAGQVELREERLVAHKQTQEVGEIQVHTEVEQTPDDSRWTPHREEVTVEHEAVGEVVSERVEPWQEGDGVFVIPVYEERLVVVKRLVLRERIHIRRVRHDRAATLRRHASPRTAGGQGPATHGRVRELYPTTDRNRSPKMKRRIRFLRGIRWPGKALE